LKHFTVASPGFGARGAQVEGVRSEEGLCPLSRKIFEFFYIKMVSSGAF